jgi:hypothetical protein
MLYVSVNKKIQDQTYDLNKTQLANGKYYRLSVCVHTIDLYY